MRSDAERLHDDVMEALESHPDPAFAKRAALREIQRFVETAEVECPLCEAEFVGIE